MGKPGSCWVEYILSIRGLFLPTESRDLSDGRCLTVDLDDGAGRGRRPSPAWVFYLNMCLF